MKKHYSTLTLLISLMLLLALPMKGAPKREHRSTWCSAYVSDWPTSPITTSSVEMTKKICMQMLDSLRKNNFNVIYYHVRAISDAMYNSKYEPWSNAVSGTRGVAPLFDPFQYIMDEAHKRGIEVYAWVNPYRYSNSGARYGAGELNYENSHPDWLLSNASETILNPAIPEVEQRIVDVCQDIITKYDVDGLVFDDYFYNNDELDVAADASYYETYKSTGGKLSQADWRRENVNTMVRKVNQMVKATKPWVRFGIGPAGVAGTAATSASKYNVDPCPSGSDWQYNQISADPLAWLSEGTIDFISPQVYWPIGSSNDYKAIATWWNYVSNKFNRHAYISQDLKDFANKTLDDYVAEINVNRNTCQNGGTGAVYFKWGTLRTSIKTINRRNYGLMNYLKNNSFQTKALEPLRSWTDGQNVNVPTNVSLIDGTQLNWNGDTGMRYVVYAIPNTVMKSEFTQQADYILDITYTNSYAITLSNPGDYWYAVSTYDRYGNESSAVSVGTSVGTAPAVNVLAPADKITIKGMANIKWESESKAFRFNLATDAAMTNVCYSIELDDKYLLTTQIPNLENGKTYYYQVAGKAIDCNNSLSEVRSFTYEPITISSPEVSATDVSLTPKVTWLAIENANYELSIATDAMMTNLAYTQSSNNNELSVPAYKLCSGTNYYAQVKAKVGTDSCYSEILPFSTIASTVVAPIFVNPDHDGVTLYSNSSIKFAPQEGVNTIRVEISASTTFPPRSTYACNINDFSFTTPDLSTIKVAGAYLKDATTYYVRARGEYNQLSSATRLYSSFAPNASYHTFVYSANTGVESLESNNEAYISYAGEPTLIIPNLTTQLNVSVYAIDGTLISNGLGTNAANGRNEISLQAIPAGSYLIVVDCNSVSRTLKLKK